MTNVLFVMDATTKGNHGCPHAYRSNKVGMLGHSLGGLTAAQAMLNDTDNRITGGINLDGGFLGPALDAGLGSWKELFLRWGSAVYNSTGPEADTSWVQYWNITDKLDSQDWRKEIHLKESLHGNFSDLPLLADVSGFRDVDPDFVNGVLGMINGTRTMNVFTAYISAFFDTVLEGKRGTLLEGPSKEYPEVYFVR